MATTEATILQIEKPCRPDRHTPIDQLFEEIVLDATEAKGLIDFARDLAASNSTGTVGASAVFTFMDSVRMKTDHIVETLEYLKYELKFREAEGRI